ncbi:class I SAM-dependent methyltransferase [Nitrosopumilus adriaticus]|uniref:class I SAM-dependent methyltransferase n=1 Tax=Nitrosopumilus adriaticus TaxID=1580092 RepID=UPI00352C1EEA
MQCVICNNLDFEIITDNLRYDIKRNVVRCKKCKVVSLENPQNNNIDYTKSVYREKYTAIVDKKSNPREFFDLQMNFQKDRIQRVKHLINDKSVILEIGSSTGHFLESIKNSVSKVVGIELDPNHAKFSRETCNLEIIETPLEKTDFGEGTFDVIFMFQVFEHIQNPIEFLENCKKILKPNGVIYVEVPNIDDALISVYESESFNKRYFRLPHVYYYSTKTLQKMFNKAGFHGTANTIQEYSLFNHINWILNNNPQNNQIDGYNSLNWKHKKSDFEIQNALLKKWFEKMNREYKELLEKNAIAEHVSFTGKLISQ